MARSALLRLSDKEKNQKKEKAMGHIGWQDPLFCVTLLCSTLAGCSLGYPENVRFRSYAFLSTAIDV
jgi:hypothetical protein